MDDSSELRHFLEVAREAARLAGQVIMPLYESGTTVELKADRTPVTRADRAAEEALRDFLLREFPSHGFLGEEFGEVAGDGRHRWIVDPIDGTKSFIHHVPLFGTLVALERDGQPAVGVIACHAAGETVSAADGLGAWLGERRARVANTAAFAEATVSMTSFSRMASIRPRAFAALTAAGSAGLVRAWGDCFGYLMVATGRADIMLDPEMSLWDAAALYPVVREAGGSITTWDGEDGPGTSVAASNGILHPELLERIRGA